MGDAGPLLVDRAEVQPALGELGGDRRVALEERHRIAGEQRVVQQGHRQVGDETVHDVVELADPFGVVGALHRGDGVPPPFGVHDADRDAHGPGDQRQVEPGLGRQAAGEGDAEPVHQAVGDRGGDQLAAQPVLREQVTEPFDRAGGERVADRVGQHRVVGGVGRQQRLLELALGPREQRGELRAGQPAARVGTCAQLLGGRQHLDLAVEVAGALEPGHEPLEGDRVLATSGELGGDGRDLPVDGVEDLCHHVVGEVGEHLVTVLRCEAPLGDRDVEEDLEVDLGVGGRDPRRVVDGVLVHA